MTTRSGRFLFCMLLEHWHSLASWAGGRAGGAAEISCNGIALLHNIPAACRQAKTYLREWPVSDFQCKP